MEVIYKLLLFIVFKSVLSIKCYHTNRECGHKKTIDEEAACKKTGYKEKICEPSYDSCVTTVVVYDTKAKIVNRYCGTEFEKQLCRKSKAGQMRQTEIIREVKCNYCKRDLCNGKSSMAAKITNVGYLTFFLCLMPFKYNLSGRTINQPEWHHVKLQ